MSDDDYNFLDDYYFFELFNTFSEANEKAKYLAVTYKGTVRVKREDRNFKILVPLWMKNEILNPPSPVLSNSKSIFEYPEDGWREHDDPFFKEQDELLREVYGNTDDWE